MPTNDDPLRYDRRETDLLLSNLIEQVASLSARVEDLARVQKMTNRLEEAQQDMSDRAIETLTRAAESGLTLQRIESRRKVGNAIGIIFAITISTALLIGYNANQQVKQQQQAFNSLQLDTVRSNYSVCVARNAQNQASALVFQAVVRYVTGLRDAERDNKTPGIEAVRQKRLVAYNDFLIFAAPLAAAKDVTVDCSIYKVREQDLIKHGAK